MSSLRTQLARAKTRSFKALYKATDLLLDSDKHIRYTYHQNGYHNPDYRFRKDQINFIHLPKTGGTSFCKMLKEGSEDRFAFMDIHKPISKYCSPKDYQYVTVLREPVARVWSYYQMVLRSQKGYPYQKWANQGLEVFLKKCWAARNMACRYLTAEMEGEPNQGTVNRALANLKDFYAVLNFAHFSQEASVFMEQHSITYEQIPNERKHSYTKPTAAEIALIKQYNQRDIVLFESWFAKENK